MAENYYFNHTATQIDAILDKVDGIEAGAQANVQSDWNQSTTTASDYIKNKPTIPDAQIQSDWNQTNMESKDFIKNKPTIPAAQVNSDWTASSGVAEILHKPALGTAAAKDYTTSVSGLSDDLITSSAVNAALADKADKSTTYTKTEVDTALVIKADLVDGKVPASELPSYVDDTIEGYYYNGAFYEDSSHTTAITGEVGKIYIDLTANKSYRWTGSVYTRIDECPAFGETTGTIYEGNKGKANADAISAIKDGLTIDSFADVESALAGKANASSLAAVATSGSYNDLSNKPTIPAAQVNADWDAVSGVSQILNKPTIPAAQVSSDWNASSGVAQILNKPTLGAAASRGVDTTATSGSTNLITSGGVYAIVGNINTVLESVL